MHFFSGIRKSSSLLIAALLLAFACVAPAFAAPQIVVAGDRADAETIRSYFNGTSPADIDRGLEALRASGRYSTISASRQGDRIVIRVAEGGLINRVALEGNSKVKSDQLLPDLRTKARAPFNPQFAESDAARITEIYKRSGRAAAKVSYRTVPLENGRIDVVFTIDEGGKTGIKEIRFSGNEVYSTRRLVGMMETTEMNLLSFYKSSDVYDPDRIAADLEIIRRFYLKNGYADFRVVSSDAQYDAQQQGYIINIVIEEGPQYRVSTVNIESHIPDIDGNSLNGELRLQSGDVYNGDAVERTVESLTRAVANKGYAFTQARPRGQRDAAARTVAIQFLLDEGPRVYIERIVIRGNTRTRDYVIRREFDLGEGDAYNRVLVDRAERRLNGLGYFKKVKVTNEPGSAPDRIVLFVDVEDQPTGNFGVSGGYATNQGFIGEVSVSESNFLGRGQAVRLSLQGGQVASGVNFSFTEPYFMDMRIAAGFDLFARHQRAYQFSIYASTSVGGTVRFGIPITNEITLSPHYSLYDTTISIPNNDRQPFNDCTVPLYTVTPGFSPFYPKDQGYPSLAVNCSSNGEAPLAIKESIGSVLTSLAGYSLTYSTVDNFRNPHNGWNATMGQDFAGLGGLSRYVRSTTDIRYFYEIPYLDDVVAIAHGQAGNLTPFGGYQPRIQDNFNMGPTLVRGFTPGGIGPRDNNWLAWNSNTNYGNALGGSNYWGASAEVQFPLYGLPKDLGLRGAAFVDAGSLWDYQGRLNYSPGGKNLSAIPYGPFQNCIAPFSPQAGYGQGTCVLPQSDNMILRASAGASILWNSPMGPLRFDYAIPFAKAQTDITQYFRFSGGTNF